MEGSLYMSECARLSYSDFQFSQNQVVFFFFGRRGERVTVVVLDSLLWLVPVRFGTHEKLVWGCWGLEVLPFSRWVLGHASIPCGRVVYVQVNINCPVPNMTPVPQIMSLADRGFSINQIAPFNTVDQQVKLLTPFPFLAPSTPTSILSGTGFSAQKIVCVQVLIYRNIAQR